MPPRARMHLPMAKAEGPPTWREYFMYTADYVGTQALAAGTVNGAPSTARFQSFEIRIDSDSDFEIIKLIQTSTDDRFYLRMQDTTSGRYLHRGSLDARMNVGRGFVTNLTETQAFLPFVWSSPQRIAAASVFNIDAGDFSGGGNTVRLTFHGNKIRPGNPPWAFDANGRPKQYKQRLWFNYPLPPDASVAAIPASGVVVFSAPIDMEADFVCYKLTGQFQGPATVLIQDGSGRDRAWMDRAVHVNNIVGNGQFPNNFTAPRFIPRGSSITVTVTDLSAATNRFRLYLEGSKLYEG